MAAIVLNSPRAANLALSACGEGGGIIGRDDDDDDNGGCTGSACGQVLIGLTDADGDFLSYAVDVVSIELEKANGNSVETLPARQRLCSSSARGRDRLAALLPPPRVHLNCLYGVFAPAA